MTTKNIIWHCTQQYSFQFSGPIYITISNFFHCSIHNYSLTIMSPGTLLRSRFIFSNSLTSYHFNNILFPRVQYLVPQQRWFSFRKKPICNLMYHTIDNLRSMYINILLNFLFNYFISLF